VQPNQTGVTTAFGCSTSLSNQIVELPPDWDSETCQCAGCQAWREHGRPPTDEWRRFQIGNIDHMDDELRAGFARIRDQLVRLLALVEAKAN
jgi:hypothetical protein